MTIDWSHDRVLITGGSGLIGANLVRRLTAMGSRPYMLLRDPAGSERLREVADDIVALRGDITDAASVQAAVATSDPRVVIHLASSHFNPPDQSAADHMQINAIGLLHLCEALKDKAGIRLVNANSCAIYAGGRGLDESTAIDPQSTYGLSKATASVVSRFYARQYGIGVAELRLFTPFGPWEQARRLIPHTILSALSGRAVEIRHGRPERDFVYVEDVVDALLLAADAAQPELFVNIGSGAGRSVRDVATRILDLMGNPVELTVGTQPGRPDEIWEMSADISAAETELGWQPRTRFDDALQKTIDWFRSHQALAPSLT